MNSVNLIPLDRRLRDDRRRRTRAWACATAVLAGLLAAAYGVAALRPDATVAPPASAFAKAAADVAHANQEAAPLRVRLAALSDDARARLLIADQPDCSVLLALLARAVDDDVVINQCELLHAAAGAPPRAAQVVKISGFARTQPSVAGFMLQLEAAGIFRSVKLVRSSEQPLLSGRAASFQVECVVGPRERGNP